MTLRYDIIKKISENIRSSDFEDVTDRSVSVAVAEDTEIRELYMEKYGNTLPHSLDNRKRSMLFRDIRRKMNGDPVQGGSKGTGHRSYSSNREIVLNFV